ncbi:MAG TPA: DUF1702 family protein [Thermoanaerobaculia bacterium]|nr:DUF1702 family protein [Thermoanaerobaculia bacterium]
MTGQRRKRARLLARLTPRLSPEEASFARRGFEPCDTAVRRHLEAIVATFISGFNAARRESDDAALAGWLRESFHPHWVGFAFEGAGAARAAEDLVTPWRSRRLETFTHGTAADHDYIATVGAGLALARLPFAARWLDRYSRTIDPLLAWCVADGVGFYHGMFRHRSAIGRCAAPPAYLSAAERQLFDAGLGRSLWWVEGASPERIRGAIARFPAARQAELWCGVGLACAYAGGVGAQALRTLLAHAGAARSDLLSGVPFACRLRQKGANPSAMTDLAAQILLASDAETCAQFLVDLQSAVFAEAGGDEGRVRAHGYGEIRRRLVEALSAGALPPFTRPGFMGPQRIDKLTPYQHRERI